jgi:protein tyrosine phosphatase (PTP) superfamily phosphohydrolase (DUF442 family)
MMTCPHSTPDSNRDKKEKTRPRNLRTRFVLLSILIAGVIVAGGLYVNDVHLQYRFRVIEDGRFYKSGAMPPDTLERFVRKYGIRTVIDLRNPGTGDDLCPEEWRDIDVQTETLKRLGVTHVLVPSNQVPSIETQEQFFRIMDNPDVYPVLVHCHHGTGRAVLFSALYRIEYMHWPVDRALKATRMILAGSSFAPDRSKGRFLQNYQPRQADHPSQSRQLFNQTIQP